MKLQDLKPSILNMTWDDQLYLHGFIRASRVTSKKPATKAGQERQALRKNVVKTINSASAAELEEMIKQLEAM